METPAAVDDMIKGVVHLPHALDLVPFQPLTTRCRGAGFGALCLLSPYLVDSLWLHANTHRARLAPGMSGQVAAA